MNEEPCWNWVCQSDMWIVTKYKLSNFGKEIYILDLLFRDAKRHVDIFFVQYQN